MAISSRRTSGSKSRIISSTAIYGILYLLLIPFFAFFYTKVPHGFYQGTIKTEAASTAHADRILKGFCQHIALQLPEAIRLGQTEAEHTDFEQAVGEYSFKPSDIGCDRLRIADADRVEFTVTIALHKRHACPAVLTFPCLDIIIIPFDVSLAPISIKTLAPEIRQFNGPLIFIHPVEAKVRQLPLFPGSDRLGLEAKKLMFSSSLTDMWSLLLEDPFDSDLEQFVKEADGFISENNDNFWRLIYFSAMTITTVGYGDIVPITPCARLLVTIEAIFGVVLIGFFLNSLKT
jgi:hypothetical protein